MKCLNRMSWRNENENSLLREVGIIKKCVLSVWIILAVILSVSSVSIGKSVFAAASHGTGKIKAYLIDPNDSISIQATLTGTENFGYGVTGLRVWPDYERLFTTYESSSKIAWASCKTFSREMDDEIDAPESNLAGMAVDELRQCLYVITRNHGHLYTYVFNEVEDTLELVYPDEQTVYRQLEELSDGCTYGIAFSEGDLLTGGTLYVADGSSEVHCYNTYTWDLIKTIDVGRAAISLDVDGDDYLYVGGLWSHNYLIRYDLQADPNQAIAEKNLGYQITDIRVNPESDHLYITTPGAGATPASVQVFDASNWIGSDPNTLVLIDTETDIDFGGPAGLDLGPSYKPDDIEIEKSDNVDGCVSPLSADPNFTYTILFRPGEKDELNVVITDELPWGVDFISANPADPNWCYYTDRPIHTYTWELGDVPGYDPNDPLAPPDPNYYFELTVRVNQWANPSGILYNKVTAESDLSYDFDDEETVVCCWSGDGIIYVDKYAPGAKTGIDWENAYTDLQDALERALEGCGSVIWIADGVYRPGITSGDTFLIPDGVEVYGGYAGYGTSDPNERDWKKYKTILSGYVNETTKNNSVVTMGDDSLLNGVTVEKGGYYGIFSNGDDFSIKNSLIENNYQKGIYCNNGNLTVEWCEIRNNEQQGIHHIGSGFSLSINNCNIHNNFRDGILTEYSMLELRNSVIYKNGTSGSYFGINTNNSGSNSEIRNNTIVHNSNEGIRHAGTNQPDVRNNILWHNNMQDESQKQLEGISARYYNCIYDPNDPQGSSTPDANGNITADPNFAYSYPVYGYYHINSGSPCRDMGDPDEQNYVQADEVDMDGDDRDLDGNVDMGADEVACEDTSNPIDWNGDGIVNLKEFSILSSAWLTQDPNSSSYPNPNDVYAWYVLDAGSKADLNQDSYVDLYDLIEFCEDSPQRWLWQACWHENYVEMMRMGIDSSIAAPPMSLSLPASKIIQSKSVYREPDPKTMEKSILEILDYVDLRIQEKDENIEGLYDIKIFLKDCLVDIQNDKLRTFF